MLNGNKIEVSLNVYSKWIYFNEDLITAPASGPWGDQPNLSEGSLAKKFLLAVCVNNFLIHISVNRLVDIQNLALVRQIYDVTELIIIGNKSQVVCSSGKHSTSILLGHWAQVLMTILLVWPVVIWAGRSSRLAITHTCGNIVIGRPWRGGEWPWMFITP